MDDTKQDSPENIPAHVMFDLMIKEAIQKFHKDMGFGEMANILITNANTLE